MLDFGCGPGTISVGLARATAPGEIASIYHLTSQWLLSPEVAEAAEEAQQLHCMIPESLHHRLRVMAAVERTTMTALVTEALNDFVESRS